MDHINHRETQDFGPRFSSNLRRLFTEEGPIQTFVFWCAEQLDASTATMADAMASRRVAGSTRTAIAEEKLPVVLAGRSNLKAFQMHLAAKKADEEEAWNGDVELFIPGGLTAVARGARGVHRALTVARTRLDADKSVPERARWIKRLDAQIEGLSPLVEQGDDVTFAHMSALSEQSVEKRNWLRTYRAVVKIAEGCLQLAGREAEFTAAVPHLTAPGARKKTDSVPNAPKPAPAPVLDA